MKQIKTYGDWRKEPYIKYNKGKDCYCIYCGESADTREHAPSRVFLDEPYPENLAVVPACYSCNNSFSSDEAYVACFIEKLARSVMPNYFKRDKIDKILTEENNLNIMLDSAITIDEESQKISYSIQMERFENVLSKLAKCHAAFEMSEFVFETENMEVNFKLSIQMTDEEWRNFNRPFKIDYIPEVGSRICNQITMSECNGEIHTYVDWIFVQECRYRYITFIDNNTVIVRIVINEFLCVEVLWNN